MRLHSGAGSDVESPVRFHRSVGWTQRVVTRTLAASRRLDAIRSAAMLHAVPTVD
jgi:hypothetical protein